MSDITAAHVEQALAVARGQRRLAKIPEADRAAVAAVLRAPDTYLATIAAAKERQASGTRASNTLHGARLRRARSA